jgi:hypothetical protein
MDPNEALHHCRAALARYLKKIDTIDSAEELMTLEMAYAFEELADHFEALDGWMSHGGFRPSAWNPHR